MELENAKLRAVNISKSFETASGSHDVVIKDISMDIAEKEIVCILCSADSAKLARAAKRLVISPPILPEAA